MSTWFSQLTGFDERSSPSEVRKNLRVNGTQLKSLVNGRTFACGTLEIPNLAELRKKVEVLFLEQDIDRANKNTGLQISEVVEDAKLLHADVTNAGAVFQVASQFNLLEMISPNITPDDGVGIYEKDPTQGPICAIACGAGTIYRNYFVDLGDQIGQTAERQIDCLADIGTAFGNDHSRLWQMKNGYALLHQDGLEEIRSRLREMSENEIDQLRAMLRIGIHRDVQVTLENCTHLLTQVYCSALPISYCRYFAPSLWHLFAQLVLDAAYEATFYAAALNAQVTGNRRLYLTLLGGGAFRNDEAWILAAIQRAVEKFRHVDLDVRIVSYRRSNPRVREMITNFMK